MWQYYGYVETGTSIVMYEYELLKELQVVRHGQIIRFSVAFTFEKPTSLLLEEHRLSIILKENFSGESLVQY